MGLSSIEQILDFAIQKEEEAKAFYISLADTVTRPGMREAFLEFAREEDGHRSRLEKIKAGELPAVSHEQIQSLGISEQVVEPAVGANMNYADALMLAMKAEKIAFKLYSDLAALSPPSLAEVFHSLANEEAKHKLRFEIEYDDHVLEGV